MRALTTILYVDDHEDILEIGKLALQKLGGFRVTTCATVSAALALAADPAAVPDLIVMDFSMPEMDGRTLLNRLRQQPGWEQVLAVFSTAHGPEEQGGRLQGPGVIGQVRKPFDPLQLATRLRELWDAHHGVDGTV
jgi:CheY-like chemotaxis protein